MLSPFQFCCKNQCKGCRYIRKRLIFVFFKLFLLVLRLTPVTITVTVTDNLFKHELQKSPRPASPFVPRLLRRPCSESRAPTTWSENLSPTEPYPHTQWSRAESQIWFRLSRAGWGEVRQLMIECVFFVRQDSDFPQFFKLNNSYLLTKVRIR